MKYDKKRASKIVRAIDSDIMEDELNRVISEITKALIRRDKDIQARITHISALPDNLDKYAELAELRIKRKEIKSVKLDVYKILRSSTNKLLIAAIDSEYN